MRKIQMENHKVAIVYLVDDNHFEVIAVRAYHQMRDPELYRKSVREHIRRLQDKKQLNSIYDI